MEAKTKEPKFQIGDIVSHCFRNGNIETKEICKILFINHDNDSTSDVIYYGIFGYKPNIGSGVQLINENDLTIVRKWHDNIEPKEQSGWHFSQVVKVEEMPLAFINVAVRCGLIPNYPSTHGPDEIVIDKEWLDEIIAFLNNKVLSDIVEGHFECKSIDDIKFYDSRIPVHVTSIVDLTHLVNNILPNAIRRVISTKCATCGYDPAWDKSKEN
jgi:hypothetical protein